MLLPTTNYWYYDNVVTNPAIAKVVMTSNVSAILYSVSLNLTTFKYMYLTKSIKFITDFATATRINGTGINDTCIAICYLQLASPAASVTITINSINYVVDIEGVLTQVLINPTFVL